MADASRDLIEDVREHLRARSGAVDWQGLCQAIEADAGELHAALSSLIESGEVELASADPPCNPSYRLVS